VGSFVKLGRGDVVVAFRDGVDHGATLGGQLVAFLSQKRCQVFLQLASPSRMLNENHYQLALWSYYIDVLPNVNM